ncbi:restriction endonuclease subunit S, partial [Pseudomonas viridiflava]|uniref:restriction endonuclease subunit S n=1 Tax=Pseudomonas viridiflava TaxID=33069 RepID=UPI0018CC75E9
GVGATVYGSNGVVGEHGSALVESEALIIGRKGSVGAIHHAKHPSWPIDTAYFVDELWGMSFRYWYYLFTSLDLRSLNRATAIPGLNRDDAYSVTIPIAPLSEQRRIA